MNRQALRALSLFTLVVALLLPGLALAQDSVAVLKVELREGASEDAVVALGEAIKGEVRGAGMALSSSGGDVTLTDIQLIIECEDATPECLDAVCDFVSSQQLIYGHMTGTQAEITWYKKGQGFERAASGEAGDGKSQEKLARRLIQGDTGTLLVSSGQEVGAEVLVDGNPVGLTPLTMEFPVGDHSVQVKKMGFEETQPKTVSLVADGQSQLDFEMVAMAGDFNMSPLMTWGIIFAGTGSGVLVGAIATGLIFESKKQDLKDLGSVDANELDKALDLEKERDNYQIAANVLYGVGGTLTAVGLTLIIVDLLDEENDQAQAGFEYNFALSGDGAAATVGLRF